MNINKKMNRLQKKVNEQIEEVILLKTDLFRENVMKYYQPILKDIENRVVEIYKYPKMEFSKFEQKGDELAEIIYPLITELDDKIYQLTKEVLKNKELSHQTKEIIDNELIAPLIQMRIPQRRGQMEINKAYHSFLSKTTRFANMTLNELANELRCEIMYHVESVLDYMESDRIIYDEDEQEENNQQKSSLVKMTELRQVIDYVEGRGYEKVRSTGSHHIYRNEEGKTTVIPIHGKDFHKGLAYNIQKQVEE